MAHSPKATNIPTGEETRKVSDYIEPYDSAKHDGLMECRGGALHS